MQNYIFAHSKQVDTLLTVIFAIVNPFDRERIAQCPGALLEAHAVAPPVFYGLPFIPFECIVHLGTGYQYYFQESSLLMATLAAHAERRHTFAEWRAGDILAVCGGIIVPKDHDFLKKAGVGAIHRPAAEILSLIQDHWLAP